MNVYLSKLVLCLGMLALLATFPLVGAEMAVPPEKPVPGEGAEGDWLGALKVGAVSLCLGLHVEKKNDGGLSAVLDSIDQGAKIPVGEISFENRTLKLSIAAIAASYEGKLNAEGSTLEGEWTQGPQNLPLTFHRQKAAFALNRPQLPKLLSPAKSEKWPAMGRTFSPLRGRLRVLGLRPRLSLGAPLALEKTTRPDRDVVGERAISIARSRLAGWCGKPSATGSRRGFP